MGQCASKPENPEQAALDREVQNEIEVDKEQALKRFKLLLLGAGNSGKSTFFKQLCQIHGDGISDDDRLHGSRYIHDSILHQMKNILDASIELKYEVASNNKASMEFLMEINRDQKITPDIVVHIKALWEDEAIQKTYKNRTNLGIVDSCPYFFNNIDRIGVEDYKPTEEDLLLARIPTTGIRESSFGVEGNIFELFDVGGQRSERSKWIHCFDDVAAVLFVVGLNCYDQNLFEDEEVNAMDESLNLFNEVINSRYFKKTSMILFLNKADLFEEKIRVKELTIWDENYKGTPNSFEEGVEYIREQFKEQSEEKDRNIYVHITTATDRANVQKVFDDVQHSIVMRALSTNGLL